VNETHWPYFPEVSHEFIATVSPLPRARGFDTSYHNHGNADNQKPIDFQAAYDSGMRFWIGRITRGADYIDPWLCQDWVTASQTPLIKMVYHVLFPGVPSIPQVDNLHDAMVYLGEAPAAICLDLERGAESGDITVTACLYNHVRTIRKWWPGKLILYSNLNYLKNFIRDTFGLPIWISWPLDAAGNYNPNDNPPLPNQLEWLMYQRSYRHLIDGLPDPTVDLDDFNGTIEQMRAYFGAPEPTPEPEPIPVPGDDMTAIDDLKAVRDRMIVIDDDLQGILVSMTDAITRLEAGVPPPPPVPVPVPPDILEMEIKRDPRTKAWCYQVWNANQGRVVEKKNAAGKPIMQEYEPTNTFSKGVRVRVYKSIVDADGDDDFYEICAMFGAHRERLFLMKDHLMKVM
jgi:GH25 family lysozyme M1 (1,4-beta-N-acetylmuramidase)